MSRIQPVDPPYLPEVQASFDKLMPPGMEPLILFRTLAHNPRVLRRVQRGGLLDPGSISLRLREIAILRTCAICGADYEWGVHAALFAGAAGLDDDALAATRQPSTDAAPFAAEERVVLRLCDELHARAAISDDLWGELARTFTEPQIIELTVLAGLYHAISFVVNVCEIEPEPWTVREPSGAGLD